MYKLIISAIQIFEILHAFLVTAWKTCKRTFVLNNPGLGQNQFAQEKQVNFLENCQKVEQLLESHKKDAKYDKFFRRTFNKMSFLN